MIDFLRYVYGEVKSKRLEKSQAIELLLQFHGRAVLPSTDTTKIHPLVHRNSSSLDEHRFSSKFAGDEIFLRDHLLDGTPVLAGVCYLEMMRAAVAQALPETATEERFSLTNVAWVRPLRFVAESREVHVALQPDKDGDVRCEIYSDASPLEGESNERVVHAQGRARFRVDSSTASLDLAKLRSLCFRTIDAGTCYTEFHRRGFVHGPSYRGIEVLHLGQQGDRPFVLAHLSLPDVVEDTAREYVLHPSLLDSALQASIGLLLQGDGNRHGTFLPFALDALVVFAPIPAQCRAYMRYGDGSSVGDDVLKLDVDVCDLDGNVCVQLRGFSGRRLGRDDLKVPMSSTTTLLVPVWEESPTPVNDTLDTDIERHVIVAVSDAMSPVMASSLSTAADSRRLILMPEPQETMAIRFARYTTQIAAKLTSLGMRASNSVVQLLVPGTRDDDTVLLMGLSGLLKSAHREYPRLRCQFVMHDFGAGVPSALKDLDEDATHAAEIIRHTDGRTEILTLKERATTTLNAPIAKQGGVYLITGGLGGIGYIFAREIATKATTPVLVLTGRSALNKSGREQLQMLQAHGAIVEYQRADVSQKGDAERLIRSIVATHGRLDGVLHAAGVLSDGALAQKSEDDFRAVFAPKVDGTLYLDAATKDLRLDYFVLFSSIAGTFGNGGQADYATANAFLDAFAIYRAALVDKGERYGRTLAVAWPLWEEGGMRVAPTALDRFKADGLVPLPTSAGVLALEQALAGTDPSVVVMHGDIHLLRKELRRSVRPTPVPKTATLPGISGLETRAAGYLTKLLSGALKLPAERVEADAPLEKYGIDSVMVLKLTGELEKVFGALPKTLFFEYQTIAELARYFIASHPQKLASLIGSDAERDSLTVDLPIANAKSMHRRSASRRNPANEMQPSGALDIAIIGTSGRYPGARDLEEFWENLKLGVDCIREVPRSRWDHDRYYDPQKGKPGKTYAKWGGFVDDVDKFDARFFNISPREAEQMDPQERLFLQCAYETLEDAGYTRESLKRFRAGGLDGNVGVFVGVMSEEYQLYGAQAQVVGQPFAIPATAATIANRVSYFLNLHGPSLALDTMCSASLTAIHLACESLRHGGCEMAIAGGVNLLVHPNKYFILAQARFASSHGRCESFGQGSDGYVPGEGVGAVLLKPLERAVADGDHIYGVIKASALNHGGKTNGYTVPNPRAQANVIARALEASGIPARAISYIEAHGTGTSLGDPIEIAGLTKAFGEHTVEKQFCAIGSVKSNIGHLESAAGIAAIAKVLLQFKYRTLVPSLHAQTLNPNIAFDETPFAVQRALSPWQRPRINVNGEVREFPRIAGISSFGAGGSNAHLIVEEHVTAERDGEVPPSQPVVVVLSARSEPQLLEQASNLRQALRSENYTDHDLPSIAYTLQVGREAMDHRLAFVARSLAECADKLESCVKRQSDSVDIHRGVVAGDAGGHRISEAAAETPTFDGVDREKLAARWVRGAAVEWNALYSDEIPRRISLPTYPFAKERYWISADVLAQLSTTRVSRSTSRLHPLLHENVSTLNEQVFRSVFDGNEFFLKDHVIRGSRILPGVAYLEMVRAAVARAVDAGPELAIELRNVVWSRPAIQGDGDLMLQVRLSPASESEIHYEVYSHSTPPGDDSEIFTHSRGRAILHSDKSAPVIDVPALKRACRTMISPTQCYDAFRSMGLEHGPAYRSLASVFVGADAQARPCVFSELRLPSELDSTLADYVLHPSLSDGALQSMVALMLGIGNPIATDPLLPFALESLEIYRPLGDTGYAFLRLVEGGDGRIHKFDIDLIDSHGVVAARLRGFSARPLLVSDEAARVALLAPEWVPAPVDIHASAPTDIEHHIVCIRSLPDDGARISPFEQQIERLQSAFADARCVAIPAHGMTEDVDLAKHYTDCAVELIDIVRRILSRKIEHPVLLQLVLQGGADAEVLLGLAKIVKTATLENPKITGQVIFCDVAETAGGFVEKVMENRRAPVTATIRYRDGARWVESLRDVAPPAHNTRPWKSGGVYWITGGVGGLGMLLAEEIARSVSGAVLLLTGRSVLSVDKQAKLDALARSASVSYHVLDVTDTKAVDDFVRTSVRRHGKLDGIVHTAGVRKDSLLLNKTAADVREVYAPKVRGLVNIDQATRELALDFVFLFSSLAAVAGNAGQADYASANSFMDHYAVYRNRMVATGARHGRTLSLSWPLWAEGGMGVDDSTRRRLRLGLGAAPLATEAGLAILDQSMTIDVDQLIVVTGDIERVKQKLTSLPTVSTEASREVVAATEVPKEWAEKLQSSLRLLIAKVLKARPDDIEANADFGELGFDSILFTEFGTVMNETYGLELAPTVFFEYPSLKRLTTYLIREHGAAFAQLNTSSGRGNSAVQSSPIRGTRERAPTGARRRRFAMTPTASASSLGEPIAVVGISGRFPRAADVEAFWRNLAAGEDCIGEIPKQRWDWEALYGDPMREPNKTNIRRAGIIDGVDEFDPLFFGISPREALLMDPQQRLLMMYAWKALEDAGYAPSTLSGTRTAIFAGTIDSGYGMLAAQAGMSLEGYTATGSAPSLGPGRMSFFLNLHGPSEPIETACSSSLIAVHRAVLAINAEQCDMAIAGGINTIVTPALHVSFTKAGLLCEDGRCKTFSKDANGYVRGEGVGMIVMKRLRDAERDGDHIYGVIRGSAENHGGRATSLTAPNPKAQADVLMAAYRRSGVDPRTVTYIEAHGTGTPLGDPIEINGLKSAFRELYASGESSTTAAARCGIGSVKTNIGHLELAAGIAGVIKVLLQFKHKTLAPSLHCEELNPHIKLQDSPFYVVREATPWEALRDTDGNELPRRAGVSSFGFSGVNAHVVFEEYIAKEGVEISCDVSRPAVIVLSAKNEARLKEQAENLLNAVETGEFSESDLPRIAYTLQVGRDAMEHRLAFTASSFVTLKEKLKGFLGGSADITECYRGDVARNKYTLSLFGGDEDLQGVVKKWAIEGKYSKLLELWANGLNFDWQLLYGETHPRRIALPTYPFARDRYWIEGTKGEMTLLSRGAPRQTATFLRPLLQQNTSTLEVQRFSSTFTGEEFFLTDHRVRGEPVLPGVAQVEMMYAATCAALGLTSDQPPPAVILKNVVFARPATVKDARLALHVTVEPQTAGELGLRIHSLTHDADQILHSQSTGALLTPTEIYRADLAALKRRVSEVIPVEGCYALYEEMGLHYGKASRGMKELYLLEEGALPQVLARLELPIEVMGTKTDYYLHPSLLDSALQAGVAFFWKTAVQDRRPALPFAIKAVHIFGPLPQEVYAHVRLGDSSRLHSDTQTFDIDVLDTTGQLKVRIEGLTARKLDASTGDQRSPVASSLPIGDSTSELHLVPVWDVAPMPATDAIDVEEGRVVAIGAGAADRAQVLVRYPTAVAIDIDTASSVDALADVLKMHDAIAHIVWTAPVDALSLESQNHGVLFGMRLAKALISLGYGKRKLSWTVLTRQAFQVCSDDGEIHPLHAAIHGFFGSVAKEFPLWRMRLIDLEAGETWSTPSPFDVRFDSKDSTLAYRRGEWYRQQLLPADVPQPAKSRFRQGGVYVVIGGAGGIGQALSDYLITNYHAQVIWLGRREKDDVVQAAIDRLATKGPAPWYLRADATDIDALNDAYAQIKERYPIIHGLVHAAIVYDEKAIATIDETTFIAGLSAKLNASIGSVQVFGRESLDFALFFSSLQSFVRAPGVSAYAAGCVFQDSYVRSFAATVSYPVKTVNWGYWGSVGVVATEDHRRLMATVGMSSIEPPEGMATIESLLAGPFDQLVFLKVTKPTALRDVPLSMDVTLTAVPDSPPAIDHVAASRSAAVVPPIDEGERSFDELLGKRLYVELDALGLFARATSLAQWRRDIGLPSHYNRWLDVSLRTLAERGYIALAENGQVSVVAPPDRALVLETWEQAKRERQEEPGLRLVDATLQALPDILKESRLATDVMFPNSSMSLVEAFYKSPRAEYFNIVLADSLLAAIEARGRENPQERLRIVEIGAGTGGTTVTVLKKLAACKEKIEEYCYSDISPAFLTYAKREFGPAHPYLSYRLFNVENPTEEQLNAIGVGQYDVAIAANVLHATSSIRSALRNAKTLLKRNGLLLLNEIAEYSLFSHLTFGLLKGWWLYEDHALRIPGSPGLSADSWQHVLHDEGFRPVLLPTQQAGLGSQIVVAQSNGIIRRVRAASVERSGIERNPAVESVSPATSTETGRAGDDVRELIKKKIAQSLQLDVRQIDSEAPFSNYGVDSIVGVELIQSINRSLGVDLETVALFEFGSVDKLTDGILARYPALRSAPAADATQVQTASKPVVRHDNDSVKTNLDSIPASTSRFASIRKSTALSSLAATSSDSSPLNEIAVIGMSGRFPGARNVREFWENLKSGKDAITEIPRERWELDGFYIENREQARAQLKSYSKLGGFIEDIDGFDAAVFAMKGPDLETCTTSERLMLETVWTLLEDAGYSRRLLEERHRSQVGVYVGAMSNVHKHAVLPISSIANRISRFFNCQGPSVAIDTASSSSLSAIYMACEALWRGDCEIAIAGGVNVLHPGSYATLCQLNVLGTRRDSRSFSVGDGVLIAECVGSFLLKPLSAALADGDSILGVIKAIDAAHAGGVNGLGQLNPKVIANLIEGNFAKAKIDLRTIGYVESAANGAPLGDAAEVSTLAKIFRAHGIGVGYCPIGSAKSNVGHAEAASSIPGLVKTILQMKYRQLVPSIGSGTPNADLKWEDLPFRLQHRIEDWEQSPIEKIENQAPRRALINSFGFGGSYVSMILEEYRAAEQAVSPSATCGPQLMVLSARSMERLQAGTRQLADFLENSDAALADIAYTLQTGREEMEARLAIVASSRDEFLAKLRLSLEPTTGTGGDNASAFFIGHSNDPQVTVRRLLDERTQETLVQSYLAQNDWEKLAIYWVHGGKVPWEKLTRQGSPRRLSLPTYPFFRPPADAMAKPRASRKSRHRIDSIEEA